ncbi:MAG TPA: conjugal transfer protein TraB, partial [Chromatiales bacterium]|nr:conjugal transfer protein TraB [Chromatiales bacterium]
MDASRKALMLRIAGVAGAIAAVLGAVIFGLWLSAPERRVQAPAAPAEAARGWRTPGETLEPEEIWVARSEAELARLRETTERLARQVESLERRIQEAEARGRRRELGASRPERRAPAPPTKAAGAGEAKPAPKREAPPPPPPPPPRTAPPLPPPPSSAQAGVARFLPPTPAGGGAQANDILVVSVAAPERPGASAGAKKEAPPRTVRDFLPAGSFVGVRLLSGLDAPTGGLAKSTPQPVLLRLTDDGTLPNRFRSRVRECFVIAAGHGDLPSERAYLRTERLSCIARDGRVLETAVKGFVTGEDGKAGLRGRLVEKRGALIAKTLLAGTLSGIGRAVSQSALTLSTSALGAVASVEPQTGKILRHGVGQGVGNALDRLARWYLERAEELYP